MVFPHVEAVQLKGLKSISHKPENKELTKRVKRNDYDQNNFEADDDIQMKYIESLIVLLN